MNRILIHLYTFEACRSDWTYAVPTLLDCRRFIHSRTQFSYNVLSKSVLALRKV
jgi:hypothetical protein